MSAVVRGVTGTEGLGLHFCAGFLSPPVNVPWLEARLGLASNQGTFTGGERKPVNVPWLEARLGLEGLVLHY